MDFLKILALAGQVHCHALSRHDPGTVIFCKGSYVVVIKLKISIYELLISLIYQIYIQGARFTKVLTNDFSSTNSLSLC